MNGPLTSIAPSAQLRHRFLIVTSAVALLLATAGSPAHASHHHHHHAAADEGRRGSSARRHHHHHLANSDSDGQQSRHHHHHSASASESRHELRAERLAERHSHRLSAHERRLAARLAREEARHEARLARLSPKVRKVYTQNAALRSGSIVKAATAFEGARYIFGGTSRSGFDCSGFTRFILGHTAGVQIPRTALEQYQGGTPIPRSKMRPGDLVFFKDTYRAGISHVGIYVGNGKFVHAANTNKGVVVEELDKQYYTDHYAGARRVAPRSQEE